MAGTRPLRLLVILAVVVGLVLPAGPAPGVGVAAAQVSDAVTLLVPDTVHANGAELAWTRYTGPSGAQFDRYEVHRSATQGFTPSSSPPDSTLLATIRDRDTTTWRDTTAAPSPSTTTKKFFYYKVVANTSASNERTVEMPLANQAKKVLQPGPAEGQVTYLRNDIAGSTGDECLDYGAAAYLRIGAATSGALHRPLLRFDLRDIPPGATVTSATLSLYHNLTSSATPGKINLHRATRAWQEGGGVNACQRTGAIWQEAQPDLPWTATTKGGDYDSAILASKTDSTVPAGWDIFTVTSLVGQWVAGTAPNHGMLLRLDSEAIPTSGARWFDYRADDEPDPTHRPTLTVDYTDASVVVAPTVALAAPSPGDRVSGTGVRLAAAASDDRRVDKVEFYVDGALKATDTAAPFETTWNSTSVATGTTHSITAKATDDAGNQTTTSAATSVTVDNTNPPTTAVTAATPGTADPSKWTVTASASDDIGVARVEFYADGSRFAEATTAPYTATWDTLDPLASAYDGAHTLTTKAYDTSGQVTTSAGRAVTVANSTGSEYQASFELNAAGTADDVVPALMTANPTAPAQEPYASPTLTRWLWSAPWDFTTLGGAAAQAAETTTATGCPTGAYCPTVTVTNTSSVAWKNNSGTDLRVWYRWYAPNGVVLYEGPASDNFPQTVQQGAVSKPLPLVINPPALPPAPSSASTGCGWTCTTRSPAAGSPRAATRPPSTTRS
jgi:hypothetical protein